MTTTRDALLAELGFVTSRKNPDKDRVAAIKAELDKHPAEDAEETPEVETAAVQAPENTAKKSGKLRKASDTD